MDFDQVAVNGMNSNDFIKILLTCVELHGILFLIFQGKPAEKQGHWRDFGQVSFLCARTERGFL